MTHLFAHLISHLICIYLSFCTEQPVNSEDSTIDMERDDDTQQEESIPEGIHPPITEGILNYFDSSPQ